MNELEQLIQQKLRTIFSDDRIQFDQSRFAGGLTNYNYIMEIHGTEYIIRKPGSLNHHMIDRSIEQINNSIASALGINSQCIYFDELTGIKVSVRIQNSKNIAQADPCLPAHIQAVSHLMKQVHASPQDFPNHFSWQDELSKYEKIVQRLKGDFFSDYMSLKELLLHFSQQQIKEQVCVPCHNDTVPENFLIDAEGRAYLIDWEYAGMNDPSWDIAAYILESNLTPEAIHFLLLEYYGQIPPPQELLKMKIWMVAQDLLWSVWSLVRHYSGDDFLDYCSRRYERFRRNIKRLTTCPECTLCDFI